MSTVSDMMFHLGGVPVNAPFMHVGKAFFVKPATGNDGASGKSPKHALKTLSEALTRVGQLASADQYGTVVYLIAESNTASATTDYQSATLDWNIDGVHLVGVGALPLIGKRARIGQLSTAVDVETLVKVSADNCIIANIQIFQGVASSTATAPVALEVTGDRNLFYNVEVMGNGDTGGSTDVAAARSLLLNDGDENTFKHCYIGLDTVTRATQEAEIEIKSSSQRNVFEDCTISSFAGAAGFVYLKADAASSAIDRFAMFERCKFINAEESTGTVMTAGIVPHASLSGMIILYDCMVMATDITAADSTKVRQLSMGSAAVASMKEMGLPLTIDVA